MNDKKRYYKLDDIGFIGVERKRTRAEVASEKVETAKIIKSYKAKQKS